MLRRVFMASDGLQRSAVAAFGLFLAGCRAEVAPPRPIAIRDVPKIAAQDGSRDVELRGVVTHFDRALGIVYLQDATGAQAFEVGNPGAPLVRGQSVVLAGALQAPEPFRLRQVRVTVLGRTEAQPKVRPIELAELVSHGAEAEWVTVHATVRSFRLGGGSAALELEDGPIRGRAVIDVFGDPHYPDLTGARVRLGGTSLTRAHVQRQPLPIDLFVPSLEDVRILQDPPLAMVPPAEDTALSLLTTAAAIRALSADEAVRGHAVHLNAIVTFNDPEQALFFVQDATGGIYVEGWRHIHPVRAGDRVDIRGRTTAGAFAPIVDQPRVRLLSHAGTPPPRRVRSGQLLTGAEDSQWLEVEGIVRSVTFDRFGTLVRIADGSLRLTVQIPTRAGHPRPTSLLNTRVRVRGVCRAVLTTGNQLADVMLHAPDLGSITVLAEAPPVPFVRPLSTLLGFHPSVTLDWEHRVRARGIVTYSRAGEMCLQDGSGSALVHTPDLPPPQIGDVVEVVGFAAAGDYKPVLEDAQVRFLAHGDVPLPTAVSPEQVFSGAFDAMLVTLDATLIELVGGRDEQQLLLRAGPYLFTAVLRGGSPLGLRAGSELRVTGVSELGTDTRAPQSFRLWLRTPRDLEVRRRGPFWDPRRAAWATAAMAIVIGLGAVWLATLRRKVRAQSAVIWERVKRETELQERHRMARELHDTLEQNLAGIGFCLEAVDRALPSSPAVARRQLALAIEQVDAGADEVRRCVWALRTPALETGGLAGALDEIGQQLARCGSQPIEVGVRVAGHPRPFATVIENHLLRIGQEAITNAVRHSGAAHVRIELRYEHGAFTLCVEDDGRGFDPQRPAPDRHFGLAGMRERADEIGGRLEIRSAAGRGTRVEVTVRLSPLAASRLAEGA